MTCPRCAGALSPDALLYRLSAGQWYTICVNCGRRYIVPVSSATPAPPPPAPPQPA